MARPFSALAAAAVTATVVLTGCSEVGLSAQDAYRIGCPAVDAVAASGSVVGKVALTGLEKLRDSGTVTGQSQSWLNAAIQFLADPDKADAGTKKLIVDGCKANGYPLQNVR